MGFKIKKVTYGNGQIRYYLLVKRGFWLRWTYLYKKNEIMLNHIKTGDKIYFETDHEIREFIEFYGTDAYKIKKIKFEHKKKSGSGGIGRRWIVKDYMNLTI